MSMELIQQSKKGLHDTGNASTKYIWWHARSDLRCQENDYHYCLSNNMLFHI